jgi:hypothetical protein
MRPTCFVSVVAVLMLAVAPATAGGELVKFGAKAGLSFATQDRDYAADIDLKTSYRAGLLLSFYADYPLIPNVSLRPEFAYVNKGCKFEVEETTEKYPEGTGRMIDINDRLDYISVQVLGKFMLPVPRPSLYALVGPRVDFKSRTSSDLPDESTFDYKSTVLGATLGAGVQYPVGPANSVFIEFNYFYDLGDAYKGDLVTVTNKAFAVAIGVSF